MEKKLLGLALVLTVALGAGCTPAADTNTVTENETSQGSPQGIAVGEPNPNTPPEDESGNEEAPGEEGEPKEEDTSTGTLDETGVRVFTVDGTSFAFAPSVMKVKKGETVRVVFNNKVGFHDWVLDEFDAATKQISAGTTDTIEFVADKTGEFEYYCSVGSHRQMGMVGTLIVEE